MERFSLCRWNVLAFANGTFSLCQWNVLAFTMQTKILESKVLPLFETFRMLFFTYMLNCFSCSKLQLSRSLIHHKVYYSSNHLAYTKYGNGPITILKKTKNGAETSTRFLPARVIRQIVRPISDQIGLETIL